MGSGRAGRKGYQMDSIEITLEKIELVKDRTGVSYKEAKEALETANGNVVDAIIYVEERIDGSAPKSRTIDNMIAKIKEAVKKGNVTKLTISKNDEMLLNLPVNIGIIGTVLFPWAGLAAAIAALGTKCEVNLVKDDGEVVSISEKVDSGIDSAKTKGGIIMDEVVDKSEDFFHYAKEKSEEFINYAKDKLNKGDKKACCEEDEKDEHCCEAEVSEEHCCEENSCCEEEAPEENRCCGDPHDESCCEEKK